MANFWASSPKECGIPIRSWLETFLLIFAARSFIQLLKIVFVKNCFSFRGTFDVFRLAFIDGFLIGWLLYGNKLFYSERNDCGLHKDTHILSIMMLTILILGYLTILVYFFILCSVPYNLLFGQGYLAADAFHDEEF